MDPALEVLMDSILAWPVRQVPGNPGPDSATFPARR